VLTLSLQMLTSTYIDYVIIKDVFLQLMTINDHQ